MKKLIILLTSLLFFGILSAQSSMRIEMSVFDTEKLQALYLSDLDILQTGTAEELFLIRLIKGSSDTFPHSYLIMQVLKDQEVLASTITRSFKIPGDPEGTSYEATNVQLSNSAFFLDPGDPETQLRIDETTVGTFFNDFQKDILASGKVPVGEYKLSARLYSDSQGADPISPPTVLPFLRVTNPSYIQLVSPGYQIGRSMNDAVYSEFPLFQWNGNGEEYEVMVFGKKNEFQSVQDILQSVPYWHSERLTTLSVQYPQGGGALPLEYGKSYYWLVNMLVNTSGGEEIQQSEIWQFNLLDPASSVNQGHAMAKDDLLTFLRQILGDRAEAIAQALYDYELSTIRLNGQEIEIDELYRLINTYRSKSIEIVDLTLPAGSR